MPKFLSLPIFVLLPFTFFAQSDAYHQAITQGESAQANRQYAQAIQYYTQAIQLEPTNVEAYLRQLNVAIQKRDLTTFKRTIGQLEGLEYPLPLEIYITYAQLAKKQRLYNDGLKMLAKAELRHKTNKTILVHRADLYQKLNDNAAVIKTLNQALELNPQNMDIVHQLATIYIDINTRKSIDLFKKLSTNPTYKDVALSSLGLLHTKLYQADPGPNNRNNLVLALQYYNEYYKKHPQNQDAKTMIDNIRILLES
ncbi:MULTISPECIES: tetratricopeptide repeat protein [unclassified Aureispira]|uniref:tetratricopeptide repeat protein n=1 Tax=unclassified Aureispira TaxID=2649989 RepID=UPI0006961273|nr:MULTISPECIES: tetratricopeptide repeat protein [unclassified Aureispira]WMX16959.1 tetratricopeptide repeat protein [Aureispira sp. CCB-E]